MKKKMICLMAALMLLLPAAAFAAGAVVDNGGDPASRLNMRSAPSADAGVIGKFVSGTPVEIVADAGSGWVQVVIGGGQSRISGYMKADYLKSSSAIDARKRCTVASPYGTQSVVLRDRPSNSYDGVMMLMVGETVTVIGTSGDFCFVQTADSSVGCLMNSELK